MIIVVEPKDSGFSPTYKPKVSTRPRPKEPPRQVQGKERAMLHKERCKYHGSERSWMENCWEETRQGRRDCRNGFNAAWSGCEETEGGGGFLLCGHRMGKVRSELGEVLGASKGLCLGCVCSCSCWLQSLCFSVQFFSKPRGWWEGKRVRPSTTRQSERCLPFWVRGDGPISLLSVAACLSGPRVQNCIFIPYLLITPSLQPGLRVKWCESRKS